MPWPYDSKPISPMANALMGRLSTPAADFDASKVWYHGTQENFNAFRPSEYGSFGPGVYVTSDASHARHFATNGPGPPGNVLNLHLRGPLAGPSDIPPEAYKNRGWKGLLGMGPSPAQEAAAWARANGFSGMQIGNEAVVFDPSNIRVLNAPQDAAIGAGILGDAIGGGAPMRNRLTDRE